MNWVSGRFESLTLGFFILPDSSIAVSIKESVSSGEARSSSESLFENSVIFIKSMITTLLPFLADSASTFL